MQSFKGKRILAQIEARNMKDVTAIKTSLKHVLMDQVLGLIWGEMNLEFESKETDNKSLEEACFQK